MYLVFDLPTPGDDFPSAHTVAFWVHRELDNWFQKHQIVYKTKYHKNRLRVIFSNEDEYYFFMLSWNPNYTIAGVKMEDKWSKYRVIHTPKH